MKDEKDLENTLLEVLKDKNIKQEELTELREEVLLLKEEINTYKRMCDEYKEAADERWERLQFYEKNNFLRILCSINMRLKKKEIEQDDFVDDIDDLGEETPTRERYYRIYSEEEKSRFDNCRRKISGISYRPLISLVIPIYNTDPRLFKELVFSLREQIYENWEVCFANGSANNVKLTEQLKKYAQKEPRIKYSILETNGGISYNTNKAFELAEGEYIAMVDHDDLLTPDALAEVIFALNQNSNLDFIYSDQDKVDDKTTVRFGRLYKPFWSKELLYSGNYITHFSVIRKKIVDEIGGWDSNYDGAQDWDLFLKVAEKTNNIYAISKVLYHWRTAPTSTAASMDNKNYAAKAQISALQSHFNRMGYNATVYFSRPKDLEIRVKWNYQVRNISIILWDSGRNKNLNDYIWFISLALNESINEIVVVSNCQERLDKIPNDCVKVYTAKKEYADAFNEGMKNATGDVFIFTTDFAFPTEADIYHELAVWAKHPEIAVVGPKILDFQGTINSLGIILNIEKPISLFRGEKNEAGKLTDFGTTSWYRDVNAVDFQCFSIEKKKADEVGAFEAKLGELAVIDYCLRARKKGYRNLVDPFAVIKSNKVFTENVDEDFIEKYHKLFKKFRLSDIDKYGNLELYQHISL